MRRIALFRNCIFIKSTLVERILSLQTQINNLSSLIFRNFGMILDSFFPVPYIMGDLDLIDSHNFSSVNIKTLKNAENLPCSYSMNEHNTIEKGRFILIDATGITIIKSDSVPTGFNKFKINIYISNLIYIIINNHEFRTKYRELLDGLLIFLYKNISNFKDDTLTLEEKEAIEDLCSILNNRKY